MVACCVVFVVMISLCFLTPATVAFSFAENGHNIANAIGDVHFHAEILSHYLRKRSLTETQKIIAAVPTVPSDQEKRYRDSGIESLFHISSDFTSLFSNEEGRIGATGLRGAN